MKRFLSIVPVLLFIFLNACATNVSAIAPSVGTAVGQTQTASIWTPTVTSTPDPNESKIVDWLNAELSSADELEKMVDATYQAQDVWFTAGSNNSSLVFRVDIRCQCSLDAQCCVPARIFVTTMLVMKKRAEKVLKEVPSNVSEVKVVGFTNGVRIGVMAALWKDARDYLLDQINGSQFGSRVYRSTLP